MKQTDVLSLSDTAETLVLLYFGLEPLVIKPPPQHGGRRQFLFKRTPEAEAVLNRLAQGRLLLEPVRLLAAQQIINKKIKHSKRLKQ